MYLINEREGEDVKGDYGHRPLINIERYILLIISNLIYYNRLL